MMNTKSLTGKVAVVVSVLAILVQNISPMTNAIDTTVDLTITAGAISVGSAGTFSLGSTIVSNTVQSVNNTFTPGNEFFVQDLKGSNTGYYTTLQISTMTWVATAATIPAANISLSVSTNATTLMTGTANTRVLANSGNTLTTPTALSAPITFIERKDGANAGKLGKYGVLPTVYASIPAFQPADVYTGTLTYTLYDVSNP